MTQLPPNASGVRRFCAGCGLWKRLYYKVREPERSLCSMCYSNPETHHKFGDGYLGPRATPPHPHVTRYLADPSFGHDDVRPTQLVWDPEVRRRNPPPWADRATGPEDRRAAEKKGE